MRNYEIIFIVRPDVTEEDVDKLIAQMEGVVAGAGGQVEKVEKLGRRRLAYRVEKQREGIYVLFRLQGSGDTVKEFERRLKVLDTVIKYLTIRIDEDLERAEKFKALRSKQESKKRRSKSAAAPPPQPAAEVPPA
jgi:small subunit ribosomal protein S6